MSSNKCAACGQWSGRGHRCPTSSAPTGPVSAPVATVAEPPATDVTDRVSRAKQAITYADFDVKAMTPQSAHENPVSAARLIMSQWREERGNWESKIITTSRGDRAVQWTSRLNPDVTVIEPATALEPAHIVVGADTTASMLKNRPPHVRITLDMNDRVRRSLTVTSPDDYVAQNFNQNGQLSNTTEQAAVVVVDGGDPVEHHFYTDGKLTGRQMWRTLYDANGKQIDNTVLNWRKQKKATGGLGEQPPGYTAFR